MEGTSVLSGVAGGLGLFLVGLWLATDGLRMAAGGLLRDHLGEWTCNRRRSFETGFAISILLPSGGGLTRAAIGLVSDERVTSRQAQWVVIGSSFGAVMTAWIVVAIGFSSILLPLALALVGIGVVFRWTGPDTDRGFWGKALVGTGVLLLGVRILSTTAVLLDHRLDTFVVDPLWRILGCAMVGAVLTAGMASTSAVVVLVFVATAGGAVELTSGAALLVGANLGAAASSLQVLRRGSPATRRLAVGHALFHGLGSAFGLLLLIFLLPALAGGSDPSGNTLLLLAGFQTIFFVVGVVLVRLVEGRMLLFLGQRFHPRLEDPERSPRLDATVLMVPELALESITAEVRRLSTLTLDLLQHLFAKHLPSEFRVQREVDAILDLAREVDDSTLRLFHTPLPRRVSGALLDTSRAAQAYRAIAEQLLPLRHRLAHEQTTLSPAVMNRLRQYEHPLLHLLQTAHPFHPAFDAATSQANLLSAEHHVRDLQSRLLAQRTTGLLDHLLLELILERLTTWRALARQAVNAAHILSPPTAPTLPTTNPPPPSPPLRKHRLTPPNPLRNAPPIE